MSDKPVVGRIEQLTNERWLTDGPNGVPFTIDNLKRAIKKFEDLGPFVKRVIISESLIERISTLPAFLKDGPMGQPSMFEVEIEFTSALQPGEYIEIYSDGSTKYHAVR